MTNLNTAIITLHASGQMAKRGITEAEVRALLASPQQVEQVRPGRIVAQGIAGGYILRVFVDVDRSPPEVITVYRSSKIDKYWRNT